MHIVHVHVKVKPEFVEAFKRASLENARNSVQEPGIARFDVIQQVDDPTRFVLVDRRGRIRGYYRTEDGESLEPLVADIRRIAQEPS